MKRSVQQVLGAVAALYVDVAFAVTLLEVAVQHAEQIDQIALWLHQLAALLPPNVSPQSVCLLALDKISESRHKV